METSTNWVVLATALLVAGCGSDDSGGGTGGAGGTAGAGGSGGSGAGGSGGSSAVPAGTIRGTVAYSGTETGSLAVGVYTACPPAGPPVNLNTRRIAEPTFPQAFELTSVDPGSYYIVAVLDVGSNNPTIPGPEDLQACSPQVTVTAEAGASTEITLDP